MEIDVQARDFTLTDGLAQAIVGAAKHYGSTFRRIVRKVAVRVYDLNGPRGGADKGCLVVADLVDGRVIVSSDVDTDLYRAIPRAFAKLKRGTQSRRQRLHARRRSSGTVPREGALRGLVKLEPPRGVLPAT
jgi:ribosome-associated translation inhibitor RaiA